jgi:hypothetical protein
LNRQILNRDGSGNFIHPADGFYHIEAKGFHRVSGGRKIVQVIDDKAVTAIVAAFNREAQAAHLRHGNEMLIDHEHCIGCSETVNSVGSSTLCHFNLH